MKVGRVLMLGNDLGYFLSHRLSLALALKGAGHEVHVAVQDGAPMERLVEHGFYAHAVPLKRSGVNPVAEAMTFIAIWRLLFRVRPDVLHLVTIKPVLYGGLASRMAPVGHAIPVITGLGYLFTNGPGWRSLFRHMARVAYRMALKHARCRVVFQNEADLREFVANGIVEAKTAAIIEGSGVDVMATAVTPEPGGVPVVLMVARLLRDKGVLEFLDAAARIRAQGIEARFQIAGGEDVNPTGLRMDELEPLAAAAGVELLGHRRDVPRLIAASTLVVLPSYREGLPKALVEAAAAARALIATDVPGCRDVVEDGVTGLLVPARDSVSLAQAIGRLLADAGLRWQMALAARRRAEQRFDCSKVLGQYVALVDSVLQCKA
jgi:glycosyltransferase involved in cell wall biosynthesis